MPDDDRTDRPLPLTNVLKAHTVVQAFVNGTTEVYMADIGDGVHRLLGVNNVEFYGTLDRLEELVAAMGELVAVWRADPHIVDRWSGAGRVGHPLARTLS